MAFHEEIDESFQSVAARALEEHKARAALLAAGVPAVEGFGKIFGLQNVIWHKINEQ